MRVPLVDLAAQLETVGPRVREAVARVIDSTQYILGPTVDAFERAMAESIGVPHAIGMSSGSDALLATLMALDVGRGDVVVTTPYTFFATGGAVARLGARLAFVDIDPRTYNMSPEGLRAWLHRERDR